MTLRIGGSSVDFKTRLNQSIIANNGPDQIIAEKAKLCSLKEEEIMNKLIQNYVKSNPILGLIPNVFIEIELNSPVPVQKKPYPLPYGLYEKVQKEIKRCLDLGIIQKSNSKYASPAFPIRKKNNSNRLVVDHRDLNSITHKEVYPFPDLWDQLNSPSGAKFYSQLDLNMGYYQIPISLKIEPKQPSHYHTDILNSREYLSGWPARQEYFKRQCILC